MKFFICVTLIAAALLLQVAEAGVFNRNDSNTTKDNIQLGVALKTYAEAFKHIMPCGYAPLKIPVLAPVNVDSYEIRSNNSYYRISGNVSNVWLTGLNDYHILGGDFNTVTNRHSFDVIFKEIQVLGEYELSEMAGLANLPISFIGNGLLNKRVTDIRFVGDFALSSGTEKTDKLSVTDLNLNIHIGNIINNNWNNLWDIPVNNLLNKFTSEFVLLWLQEVQKYMHNISAEFLLPEINDKLKNVSITELTDILIAQSLEFAKVNCEQA